MTKDTSDPFSNDQQRDIQYEFWLISSLYIIGTFIFNSLQLFR